MTTKTDAHGMDEAQEPAYARLGTHVILPRLSYYEILRFMEDEQAKAAHKASNKWPELSVVNRAKLLTDMLNDLRRHGRNSGLY